jgi:Tol biopolymer transport system component
MRQHTILSTLSLVLVIAACGDERERVAPAALAASGATPAATTWRAWGGPGVELSGAPSPDGRLLSFVDWDTGDLAARDLETGEARRLTDKGSWQESGEYALASVWAPDGGAVAYSWFKPRPPQHLIHYELRVVDAAGGEPRVVYSNPGNVPYLVPQAWSPDGRWILTALYGADRTIQLALISAATGEARVLKSLGWREPTKAAFSPDGRFIAYDLPAETTTSPRDVLVLATGGSRETRVVASPADERLLGWLASGTLLYMSDASGRPAVWSQAMRDGRPAGAPVLLRGDAWGVITLGTAGDRLAYGVLVESPKVVLAVVDIERGALLTEPAPLSHPAAERHGPSDWSADGRTLAYSLRGVPQQAGVTTIIVRDADGGATAREIPIEFERVRHLRWSPDGRSLLLVGAGPQGRGGVYRLELASGRLDRIALAPRDATFARWPVWSADGRTVRFLRQQPPPRPNGVVSMDAVTGEERPLLPLHGATAFAPAPDGSRYAVVLEEPRDGARLDVVQASGGAPRTLVRFRPEDEYGGLNWRGGVLWTADGRHLVYSRARLDGSASVWAISPEGGEPRLLFEDTSVWDLRLHPDGRRFAFTRDRERGEVWVLEPDR